MAVHHVPIATEMHHDVGMNEGFGNPQISEVFAEVLFRGAMLP